MRIESLSPEPDRAGRYGVRFSDGETMRLYRQTVEDFGLYTGMELSEEEFGALQSAAGEMSAKMRAVRIVAATGISKKELEQRLVHKGEDPDQAKNAVAWMEELNLIDDATTAKQIVSRCISRGYGLARAKQTLYEKRIPKSLWEDALADYPDQSDKILEFLRSRLDTRSDDRAVKRAVDALLRRGHSYSDIQRCLRQLENSVESFLEEY